MVVNDFTPVDKAAFVELVESSIDAGVFSRRELNTAVTHCLIFAGLQPTAWRTVIGEKNPAEVDFFSKCKVPQLSSGSLMTLCMSVALSAKGFAIDESRQQITSFGRPMNGQTVDRYLDFKARLKQCEVPKLEKECESIFLFAAMKPRVMTLYGNGFKARQPGVQIHHIDSVILPLFNHVSSNAWQADGMHQNLANLLPYLVVNYQSCDLGEWATRLSQDTNVATAQTHTQRWSKSEFCAGISTLQSRKNELRQWLSPTVASSLPVAAGPTAEETSTMKKSDLRRWYERTRQDVELLCKAQPPAAARLQVLQARVTAEQERRMDVLPKVSAIAKIDNSDVRAASVPVAALDWSGSALPLEEQVRRTVEYIEKEARTTTFLTGFMVK